MHQHHDYEHCDHDLNDRETSSSEVKKNIANTPPHCALSSEVHVSLRHIPVVRIFMNIQNIRCGCKIITR